MQNVSACLESLEHRRFFSIAFSHHVLNIAGSAGAPNTIVVGLTPDAQSVTATLSFPWHKTTRNYALTTPLSKGINLIKISGGNGSDSITVDQTNGSFTINTRIYTHNGNDTVVGGNESDYVRCGNGIDAVMSGNGNDTLIAGRGPDSLIAGNGNDQIHAGRGYDLIVAGDGMNTFTDGYGRNTIMAGTGHDTYIIKNRRIGLDTTNYNPAKDNLKNYKPANGNSNGWVNDVVNAVLGYLL